MRPSGPMLRGEANEPGSVVNRPPVANAAPSLACTPPGSADDSNPAPPGGDVGGASRPNAPCSPFPANPAPASRARSARCSSCPGTGGSPSARSGNRASSPTETSSTLSPRASNALRKESIEPPRMARARALDASNRARTPPPFAESIRRWTRSIPRCAGFSRSVTAPVPASPPTHAPEAAAWYAARSMPRWACACTARWNSLPPPGVGWALFSATIGARAGSPTSRPRRSISPLDPTLPTAGSATSLAGPSVGVRTPGRSPSPPGPFSVEPFEDEPMGETPP